MWLGASATDTHAQDIAVVIIKCQYRYVALYYRRCAAMRMFIDRAY